MGGDAGAGRSGGNNTAPEAAIVTPASDSGIDNSAYVYDGFDTDSDDETTSSAPRSLFIWNLC